MRYWLMKSEPDVYSFDDLLKDGRTMWDSIRNYQARNFMRDDMKIGDQVLFYHSNAKPPGVAGIAEVVSEPYPDPVQFDPASNYHDPKSDPDKPTWSFVARRAKKNQACYSDASPRLLVATWDGRGISRYAECAG